MRGSVFGKDQRLVDTNFRPGPQKEQALKLAGWL